MTHYYVSGVVVTRDPTYFQIMEEKDGKQTCIAMVPFNNHVRDIHSRIPAKADAELIVAALNFYEKEHST